jgi:hypothetical protein
LLSNEAGIDFGGKNIVLQSSDPNNPAIVASTIIDCQMLNTQKYFRKRAFHFHNGETSDCIIEGFTIRNGSWIGDIGITGGLYDGGPLTMYDPNDENPPIQMSSGTSASGDGYGGAILCENASSPTFRKIVIEDCTVTASTGGDGYDGPIIEEDDDTHGYWGGHGGSATGNGYGGAVACIGGSSPTFTDCSFTDCLARGPWAGDGGDGTQENEGNGMQGAGGNGGMAQGDGRGGAIYCENGSNAVFTNCTFTDNHATSGIAGTAGVHGPGDQPEDPYPSNVITGDALDGTPGFYYSNGYIAGGAIYQNNAAPVFIECQFNGNEAYQLTTYLLISEYSYYSYTQGGGIFASAGSGIYLQKCTFTNNVSNAVNANSQCIVDINECTFTQNPGTSYLEDSSLSTLTYITPVLSGNGGGALYIGQNCPSVTVNKSAFLNNNASKVVQLTYYQVQILVAVRLQEIKVLITAVL